MMSATFSRTAFSAAAATLVFAFAGCSTPGGTQQAADGGISDPIEPVNRAVFAFNEVADKAVIRPVAEGYSIVVPDPIRDNVRTFIRNLLTPLSIAHNLLQGDLQGAGTMTARLMTNAVLGFGFTDVASAANIGYDPEDMGQTLAVWGMDSGPYIVIPLLGPSNARDAVGMVADSFADPVGLKMTRTMWLSELATSGVDTRSRYLKEIDELRRSSLDYYATMRSLSQQQRKAQINDNKNTIQPEFPNYDQAPVATQPPAANKAPVATKPSAKAMPAAKAKQTKVVKPVAAGLSPVAHKTPAAGKPPPAKYPAKKLPVSTP